MVVSKEHANSYNKIAEIPKNEHLPVCLLEEISPLTKRTKNCVNLSDVAACYSEKLLETWKDFSSIRRAYM